MKSISFLEKIIQVENNLTSILIKNITREWLDFPNLKIKLPQC